MIGFIAAGKSAWIRGWRQEAIPARTLTVCDTALCYALIYTPPEYSLIMPAGSIITNAEDFVAVVLKILETARHETAFIFSPSLLSFAGTYDSAEHAKRFIENGGVVRGIVPISLANIEAARLRLDIGEDLRHSDEVHEFLMFVGDRRYSISAINIGIDDFTGGTPFTAFWSESLPYAEYLLASFENAWSRAIPAERRIQELLEHKEGQL